MATESAKMESIQVMQTLKPKMDTVVTEIEEIDESVVSVTKSTESITKAYAVSETKFDCVYQPAKIFKNFECAYPTVDPNVKRVSQPLPFPEKLQDLIGWTDAFVDRIASMTDAQERKTKKERVRLETEIERIRKALDVTLVDLDRSRGEVLAANKRTDMVQKELAASKKESETLAATIKEMEAQKLRHGAEDRTVRYQLAEEKRKVKAQEKTIEKLREQKEHLIKKGEELRKGFAAEHAEFVKEQKHHDADHKALEDAQKQFEAEHKHWEAERKEKEKVQVDLAKARKTIEIKDKEMGEFKSKVDDLDKKLGGARNENIRLEKELKARTSKCNQLDVDLKDSSKRIVELKQEVESAQKRIFDLGEGLTVANGKVATLEKTVASLAENIATLKEDNKNEVARLENERKSVSEKLTIAEAALVTVNKDLEHLQNDYSRMKKEYGHTLLHEDEKLQKHMVSHEGDAVVAQKMKDLEASLKTATADLTVTKAKLEAEEKKVNELKGRLVPVPEGRENGIRILSVEYGGKLYNPKEHKDVYEKLYVKADKGEKFKIDNEFFGGRSQDPWKGHCKTGVVTYQLPTGGAPITIVAKENSKDHGTVMQFVKPNH